MCAVCDGQGLTDGDGAMVECPGCGTTDVLVDGQMAFPGVVGMCVECGEMEDSPWATVNCVFEREVVTA